MKEDANNLKEGQKGIKKDLKALKEHVSELDPKNADRHLDIKKLIDGLREDLNTIEIVTSKNSNDIAKIKSVK